MSTTFIYGLIDPRTDEIRYIGKSNDPTIRLIGHFKILDKSFSHKSNWLKLLKNENLKPEIFIIDEVSIEEWQFWEQHYISLYKSWNCKLTNSTLGGDSGSGKGEIGYKYKHKEEILQQISNSLKGDKNPNFGKKMSEETKIKRRENMIKKGNHPSQLKVKYKHSEETKIKMRLIKQQKRINKNI